MSGTRNYIPMRRPALFPRQTFRLQTSGKDGLEPPSPSYNWHVPNYLHFPINPDSRVSKVFYVLCLNTRRFGLRQHRLYGRAPLHGLNFAIQLYTHKEVRRHALAAMIRVGNCIRFSTSCFLCWLNTAFSTKDTHLLKERRKIMKNTSMSSIPAYESSLRIYCTTEPLKSCGTCFRHVSSTFIMCY